jgi:hypothetical protein
MRQRRGLLPLGSSALAIRAFGAAVLGWTWHEPCLAVGMTAPLMAITHSLLVPTKP